MISRKRPFFYTEKKSSWSPLGLFLILLLLIVFFLWGSSIPSVRRLVDWRFYGAFSYVKSLFFPVSMPDVSSFREATLYPTLDLPSGDVLFSSDLDSIQVTPSVLNLQPTPTATQGVAWVYMPTEVIPGQRVISASEMIQLTIQPPVYEPQSYLNDAPAILSAALRANGKTENQYRIQQVIRPDALAPFVSFERMAEYVEKEYTDLLAVIRINGDKELLIDLLGAGFQVILRIQRVLPIDEWKNDDRLTARCILLTGYIGETDTFLFEDPFSGSGNSELSAQLLSDWYVFQREYLIVTSLEKEMDLYEVLMENADENTNSQLAMTKFRTDSELAPQNPYTWLNYGTLLVQSNQNETAWNAFRTAISLGIPQRTVLYNECIYRAVFSTGDVDKLLELTNFGLRMNAHSEQSVLWCGWAEAMKGNFQAANKLFNKALSIRPQYDDALYALEWLAQNQQ